MGRLGPKVDHFEVPPIAPGRQLIVPIGRQTVPEFVAAGGTAPLALTGPDQNLPHNAGADSIIGINSFIEGEHTPDHRTAPAFQRRGLAACPLARSLVPNMAHLIFDLLSLSPLVIVLVQSCVSKCIVHAGP